MVDVEVSQPLESREITGLPPPAALLGVQGRFPDSQLTIARLDDCVTERERMDRRDLDRLRARRPEKEGDDDDIAQPTQRRLSVQATAAREIEQIKDRERQQIPLGRRGEPEDVARWIVALADPHASWVTAANPSRPVGVLPVGRFALDCRDLS